MKPETISKFRFMVLGLSDQALQIVFDVILGEICRRGRKIKRWGKDSPNPKDMRRIKEG